ncbi:MAG: 6-phospho-3-hexuloisomerase [Candidatus Altiarchaeales archaeon]|nr:6-phospho-3-hexuloisomerase [Candidatus Altiarchaeales archaeon]
MPIKSAMKQIADHVHKTIEKLDDLEVDVMIEAVKKADRIFLMGVGRSGLVSKAFAMRLVHLGLKAHVIGETTTPSITKNDLLIAVSGSGSTNSVVKAVEISKKVGTKVLAVTSYPNSDLGKLADHVVKIEGRTKLDASRDDLKRELTGYEQLTPLGTLFEDTVMIFFDGIIAKLMNELGTKETDMQHRHAKLEWFY